MASSSFNWVSVLRITLLIFLIAGITVACYTFPVEKALKAFLLWVEEDLGPWGPFVLAFAYVPLTVLAVPASVLTLGGGYLFGLATGFLADSTGAVLGATAAFLLGRTIGRPYVIAKLGDYPQFRAIAIAIEKSGFKIVLLLRLVPLLPFNMMNYLLSVTPISICEYVMASWLGMMPITFALVYCGTTLKNLSDVTHGWGPFSKTRWAFVILSCMVSLILMLIVTKVAKSALEKALAEGVDIGGSGAESSSAVEEARVDIHDPLLVKVPDLETVKFKVLSRNDQYEIRELEPYFVAETTMPGKYGFNLNGSSQSFNVLAEYLYGKNTANEAMEMTPPVLT